MTKDIKDFLPLYLGKKILIEEDCYHQTSILWVAGVWELSPALLSFLIKYNAKFKLILRHVSSMNEEEAIKIADIVIGSFDSVKWKVEKKLSSKGEFAYFDIHKKHRGYSKSLSIDECGEIDVFDGDSLDQYLHQHEVTRTLLKMGFDLFKLHEAGLCLYETDLQPLKN